MSVRTVTVGPSGSGATYTSVSSALTAISSGSYTDSVLGAQTWGGGTNLVTDAKIWNIQLMSGGEIIDTAIDCASSYTTSASYYVLINPYAGQGFRDNANIRNNPLCYNPAVGAALRVQPASPYTNAINLSSYAQIRNIQLRVNYNVQAEAITGGSNLLLDSSIVDMTSYKGLQQGGTISNSLILQRNTGTQCYIACNPGNNTNYYGNTILNLGTAPTSYCFSNGSGNTFNTKNNALFGFSNYKQYTLITETYNASNSTLSGTNDVSGLTTANQFVNYTNATTTCSGNQAAGTRTWTPASMTGISVGTVLCLDALNSTPAIQEIVTVTAVTGTTFTCVTINAHNGSSTPFSIQVYGDFRTVATGGLKAGIYDGTNSPNDISNTAHNATNPYIGCWEALSSLKPWWHWAAQKSMGAA